MSTRCDDGDGVGTTKTIRSKKTRQSLKTGTKKKIKINKTKQKRSSGNLRWRRKNNTIKRGIGNVFRETEIFSEHRQQEP